MSTEAAARAGIPARMRVVEITAPGGPEVLRTGERSVPAPAPGEVLIRVAAAGVNRPDCLQRRGLYAPPPGTTDIPGLEVAGVVVARAADVADPAVGSRVCALLAGGGYAEFVAVPAVQCLPKPGILSWVQAAAIPETFFTVWTNVFERARLQPGETLLVHGGASGIGTTAIQLGRAFGARVIATVGNAEKRELCERIGAERAINYREEKFPDVVRELTNGRGVDVILDIVGGDYLEGNLSALAVEGRLVVIGTLGGARGTLNLAQMLTKRLTITASTLRPRTPQEKGRIAQALRHRVWPWLEAGAVAPVIQATLPLAAAASAHEQLEANATMGKIVLVVNESL
jgi:putative PIG3 family NAD(P)H quinone oxidoreductase